MASTFPAIRAGMGENEFYCSVLTFGEAARLIQFVEDVDDWSADTDPEAKIQRRLNVARVEREMVPYLLTVPDHFYSALTVEIRPAITEGFDGHLPFEAVGGSITGGMAWGQLVLDGTETLYALDGQHRLKSIQLAIRQRPELAREQIPVIFVPHRSQRRSQLLFSDLNRFAKSPSKSISLLFSHRDPVVTLAKTLMERVDFLAGRVEVETTSLSKHTPNVMTLSSLYEMTRSLTEGREVGDPLAEAEIDRQLAIWGGLTKYVEPWRKVVAREEHPAFLRKEFIAMHGVCHQAIAGAVAPLLAEDAEIDGVLEPLSNVDWRISNPEWQGIAVQGRHINNTSTTVRYLAGLISLKIGGGVETGVAQSLVAIIRGRGDRPPNEIGPGRSGLRVSRAVQAAGQLSFLATDAPALTSERPVLRVVIPCSKWKRASEATASRDDLDKRRAEVHERLAALAQPARELYTGRAYRRVLVAMDRFAERRPDLPIALHIASAGYGIVAGEEPIVPYEALMGAGVRQWTARGQFLGMPQQARSLIESCDLTILALSQPYFTGAAVATIEPESGSGVVIGAGQSPRSPRLRTVVASRRQARGLDTTEREVASVVLELMLDKIATHGTDVVHQLSADPLEWTTG